MRKSKKIILLILPFFLFFSFLNVKAEEKDLVCNFSSDDVVEVARHCNGFIYSYAYYDTELNNYISGPTEKDLSIPPGYLLWFNKAFDFDVEVGPPSHFPPYMFSIGGNYLNNFWYEYNFEKGKKYKIVYTLASSSDIHVTTNNLDALNSGLFDMRVHTTSNDELLEVTSDILSKYIILLSEEKDFYDDETVLTSKIELTIEFEAKVDFNKLQFRVGTPKLDSEYVERLIYNDNTSSYDIAYRDFSIKEIDSLSSSGSDHGGGGYDFDKKSPHDDNNLSEYSTCDGPLDFMCHVYNIYVTIKNLFTRIGNFFQWIYEFFSNFIITLVSNIIDGISSLFKYLFIPSDDYFELRFNALKKILEEKFSLLFFPITYLLDVLSRFNNLSLTEPIINIPDISIGNYGVLIHATTWKVDEFWKSGSLGQLYTYYLIWIYFYVAYLLYKLLMAKFHKMFGVGDSSEGDPSDNKKSNTKEDSV